MKFTPIKVRGKRRRRGEPEAVPLPKRPKTQVVRRTHKSRKPKVSVLERTLPLEIMERVFWFSENVSLPRSSPRIGRLLSGKATLRHTFINAFSPAWEAWYTCMRFNRELIQGLFDWPAFYARFGGNSEFQSALLECSWTDVDLIFASWDLWLGRHTKDRPLETPMLRQLMEGLPCTIRSNTNGNEVLPAEDADYSSGSRCCFDHDCVTLHRLNDATQPSLRDSLRDLMSSDPSLPRIHPKTRIPNHLLTGPWDEEALKKLIWLVRAGGCLLQDQTWEVTLQGFRNAMSGLRGDINMVIIYLFDKLSVFETWPNFVGTEVMDEVDEASKQGHHAPWKYQYIHEKLFACLIPRPGR